MINDAPLLIDVRLRNNRQWGFQFRAKYLDWEGHFDANLRKGDLSPALKITFPKNLCMRIDARF